MSKKNANFPCPKHLKGYAREYWNEYAPLLSGGKQTLTNWDLGSFELLCEAYAAAKDANDVVREEGQVLKKENGTQLKHPAVAIFNQNMKSYLDYAKEFGLTPMSRKRIDIKLSKTTKNKFKEAGL